MADRDLIAESFLRVKEDIARLNSELLELKQEHRRVLEENIEFKKDQKQGNGHAIDEEVIARIVHETLKNIPKNSSKFNDAMLKKLNKKRKSIIRSRIYSLASEHLPVAEIREIVVDQEALCSKATFYRYLNKMKNNGQVNSLRINDSEVIVN